VESFAARQAVITTDNAIGAKAETRELIAKIIAEHPEADIEQGECQQHQSQLWITNPSKAAYGAKGSSPPPPFAICVL